MYLYVLSSPSFSHFFRNNIVSFLKKMNGQQSQSRDNRAGEKGIHPPNKNITTTLAQGLLDLDPKSLLNIDLDSIFNPNVTTLQAQGKNDDLDFESYPINPLGVEETYNSPSGSNAIFEAQLNGSEVGYRIPREATDGTHGSVSRPAEIRGSSTFRANDYKKEKFEPEIAKLFLSLLEQRKVKVRRLTSNRGNVKKPLWEDISNTLLQLTNKKFSPSQCACKWKNIKQDYKNFLGYVLLNQNWGFFIQKHTELVTFIDKRTITCCTQRMFYTNQSNH
ncbi:hypothetical protein GLOIN_2v1840041 [Rhizophagus irregularis DAOM 181602=DAOM 197198]|uniref:Myb/SANT-like DNA-binding domain-containing protein n=1 Tax=Rhizophagus irregularis (strain DAOM 181602 / DAOM 197198 / MUCL 43194) TaxID=747089 RepID=A0A2P4Q6B3_RHIID|nr:hypothetical protein GLOIN_2v1840041 [Rhizophagus irregularis DAOM 181602=DAOM 197198]POG73183.1 hypothetical protein GLOIN_2v1840041 [Rhizophagus irregularis DAOM 181602=DAOM 197198]|eukprot:XP_025180049.1 hypothetical protein GLOIN_2v1840041 [Rhizophagus irregularis DAOM 181602=DAOM 197198]